MSVLNISNSTLGKLPTRFPDYEYFPGDELEMSFTFKTKATLSTPSQPIDISNSVFTVAMRGTTDLTALPEIDLANGAQGQLFLRWSREKVATFSRQFVIVIAETGSSNILDEDITWDELDPDITWDEFPDSTWESSTIWGRSILTGRIVRNCNGR